MSALIGAVALLGMPSLLAKQDGTYILSALDLSPMTNGWSRPGIDKSIEGKPITLGGKTFAHGIGAHADARLDLLVSNSQEFFATVGVDDETKGKGSVEFIVMVDGKTKWKSGTMRGGDTPKPVSVDLKGAKTLTLLATTAGDGGGYDHADWADARVRGGATPQPVQDLKPVTIATGGAELRMYVDDEGRLWQRFFGKRGGTSNASEVAFPSAGDGWSYEPALQVVHGDGNTSLDLRVVSMEQRGATTRVRMKDPAYNFGVDLIYRSVPDRDVIESWTEIRHSESKPVVLKSYASSAPDFGSGDFYLTQFHGDWSNEANMQEEQLGFGIKTIDSKLGVRANLRTAPWFLLSRGGMAQENSGEVFAGSLAWSGSFRFAFERSADGRVRATCGVNPYMAEYRLPAGETFTTPKMIWAWSGNGTGELSRKLHRYLREDVLRDGDKPRDILLNNWESTYFDFDQKKLESLFGKAKELGIELFLLDDGWFGTKYPRNDDTQGLGDWTPNPKKLPQGVPGLTAAAKREGLRFGLWFEPEMVNPRSEMFDRHPDWAIRQPKRELDLQRNQLILDLSNPKVEAYAYSVVDKYLTDNPDLTYVKWDCNRFISQPGSPYLPKDRQSELWARYVRALYRIFDRLKAKHPGVEMMMCSGGGGRVDYGAMNFAHEYWPSDQTDPAKRIFIQWGYSFLLPPIASANHVTRAGNHGLKFAFDVAMSGVMGMDVDLDRMTPAEHDFTKRAIATYKEIRDTVQLGEQFRLESPYAGSRSAVMNVRGSEAVVFVYSLGDSSAMPLKLQGLQPTRSYRITEVNTEGAGTAASTVISGRELMESGLALPALGRYKSAIYRLKAE